MLESSEIAHLDALRHSYSEDRYVHLPCMLSQDMLDVVVPYAHILGATRQQAIQNLWLACVSSSWAR